MSAPVSTYRLAKRMIDVSVGTLMLTLALPMMAVIALLIWREDRGAPVFFRQPRCGKGGRTFELLKFRTMVRNADELKEQLRAQSEVPWPDFRLTHDPRVTTVGRLLRKSSLDELPQLLNVIRGDMSLVGPRPTSFAASTYELWETARLDFRPGITGPWQVWGRTSMDFEQRCRLEIGFFRRPSLLKELWLLVVTVRIVLRRTGVA